MKLITTYIAILAISTHIFYTSGHLLDYYVNSDFYKARCENKARPKLNCNGKCILAKKLAAASKEPTRDSQAVIPSMSYEYLCSYLMLDDSDQIISLGREYGEYVNSYAYSYSLSLLKPPIY